MLQPIYKKMNSSNFILLCAFSFLIACSGNPKNTNDYSEYHLEVIEIENFISDNKFEKALDAYEKLFGSHAFIFQRDYKIAAQLALYLDKNERAIAYIKKGIACGWELRHVRENNLLAKMLTKEDWKNLEKEYDQYRSQYLSRIDTTIRNKVESMFNLDQNLARQASLIEDENEQEEFFVNQFAAHSNDQLQNLITIINNSTYPGERLIGNDFWVSTILSHHNSISSEFIRNDALYEYLRPALFSALNKGYISPYELALIEDWKKAVASGWEESVYGYLVAPSPENISMINNSRQKLGLRTITLRNKLVDIEQATGMRLYLPDWVEGKIIVK